VKEPSQVDFSVVIQAYNEAQSLEQVVMELLGVLQALGHSFEILIVDDGSRDGTSMLADQLSAKIPEVRVVHHEANLGLGGVYRTGFQQSHGRFATFFPADGQFDAAIVSQMAGLIDNYDMVLGYLTGLRDTLLSRFLSWGERLFYRLFFGPIPRFQGILMFRRQILQTFPLKSGGRGWAVLMELILKTSHSGYKITSVPTGKLRPRKYGKSKVNNFKTIWANMKEAMALRHLL
jgi:glycosyltransferase involved in cell wall biosynthesis